MRVQPSMPEVGDFVQRRDNRRIGTVDFIAAEGDMHPLPLFVGDVAVVFDPGRSMVTSSNIFWEKWAPVDIEALAREAMATALRAA